MQNQVKMRWMKKAVEVTKNAVATALTKMNLVRCVSILYCYYCCCVVVGIVVVVVVVIAVGVVVACCCCCSVGVVVTVILLYYQYTTIITTTSIALLLLLLIDCIGKSKKDGKYAGISELTGIISHGPMLDEKRDKDGYIIIKFECQWKNKETTWQYIDDIKNSKAIRDKYLKDQKLSVDLETGGWINYGDFKHLFEASVKRKSAKVKQKR
jgi:hypothetical protein